MKLKSYKNLIILGAAFWVSVALYFWFIKSPYFEPFTTWAQANTFLFYTILVGLKIIGIVWPPLPGGLLTIGSIPLIGWFNAYLVDFWGNVIGSSIAYFLGRKYGLALVGKIVDEEILKKIKKLKIKKNREVESIFMLRVFGGGALFEVVAYGAGLFKLSYKNFIIGAILAHIIIAVPFYYFLGSLFSGKNLIWAAISAVVILILITKFRGRYLA